MIKDVERRKNKKICKVIITCIHNKESINQETGRDVRHVVIIHPADETSITAKLGVITTEADVTYNMETKF